MLQQNWDPDPSFHGCSMIHCHFTECEHKKQFRVTSHSLPQFFSMIMIRSITFITKKHQYLKQLFCEDDRKKYHHGHTRSKTGREMPHYKTMSNGKLSLYEQT